MIKAPQCLHVPTLYENEACSIAWQPLDKADEYELEGVFDESFEDALHGQPWYAARTTPFSWEERHLTWQEMRQLPAIGISWGNITGGQSSWETADNTEYTWLDLRSRPAKLTVYKGKGEPAPDNKGLMWGDIRTAQTDWDYIVIAGYSWEEMREIEQKGVLWEDIRAVLLPWTSLLAKEHTWADMRKSPGHKNHVRAQTKIPRNIRQAQYRIRANRSGTYSDYFPANPQNIIPLFLREGDYQLAVKKGQSYSVLLSGQRIPVFHGVQMNIEYDKTCLELIKSTEGTINKADVKILNQYDGTLRFCCYRNIPEQMEWSGMMLLLEFTAKATGTTTLRVG